MVRQMWPDGVQPVTLPPMFVVLGGENYGLAESPHGGEFEGPILLQMQSSTQGASIAYTFETGDDVHWQLYHEPLRLPACTTQIRAKAIRIGYRESDEAQATFVIRE
ncbi:MAG: chitobiase/beta-hexosaminidase C-terminal domain-containing protein [Caldilineaceae bacterium]